MISGEAKLFFEGEESPAQTISIEYGRLCHFNSARTHRIINDSSDRAEFLVIRFHRDGERAQS